MLILLNINKIVLCTLSILDVYIVVNIFDYDDDDDDDDDNNLNKYLVIVLRLFFLL